MLFLNHTTCHWRRPATYDGNSTHLVVALGTVLLHELTRRMVLRQRDYGSQYRYGMAIYHGFSYQAWGPQHAKRDGTPDIYPAIQQDPDQSILGAAPAELPVID